MAKSMRVLLLAIFIPLIGFAQRDNRELPLFENLPYFQLQDSIKGWSISADGQWLSAEKVIPVIGISRNHEFYEQKNNYLGIDNIESLQAYRVKYGKDTMICLIKIFKTGYFKYPNRKRGWRELSNFYYWMVDYDHLSKAFDHFKDNDTGQTFVLKIRSYDSGMVEDIDEDDIIDELRARVLIKPDFDRNLVISLRQGPSSDRIQFHLCSLHMVFSDVEGVREDFRRRGRSLYGSTLLFDYLYFETNKTAFNQILELGASLEEFGADLDSPFKDDDSALGEIELSDEPMEDWDEEEELN